MRAKGFTLIELLVVMAILAILVSIIAGGFRSAQMRGRDAQRKSDLKGIANALEIYLSDHGEYPDESNGLIAACPSTTLSPCTWGESQMTDGNTVYFAQLPGDPVKNQRYYYRVVPGSNNQKYQLFARLENSEDKDCLGGDCKAPPVAYTCGTNTCNFSITSQNTTPTE